MYFRQNWSAAFFRFQDITVQTYHFSHTSELPFCRYCERRLTFRKLAYILLEKQLNYNSDLLLGLDISVANIYWKLETRSNLKKLFPIGNPGENSKGNLSCYFLGMDSRKSSNLVKLVFKSVKIFWEKIELKISADLNALLILNMKLNNY